MYRVVWKGADNIDCIQECEDLTAAMSWAKGLNRFVTIKCGEIEIVGMFGADGIKDGKTPNGADYTWYKRRPCPY